MFRKWVTELIADDKDAPVVERSINKTIDGLTVKGISLAGSHIGSKPVDPPEGVEEEFDANKKGLFRPKGQA